MEDGGWKCTADQFGKAFKAVLWCFQPPHPTGWGACRPGTVFEWGQTGFAASLTIVCSMSQLIITILMGCTGLLLLMDKISGQILSVPVAAAMAEIISVWISCCIAGDCTVLFSYLFGKLFEKLPWLNRHIPGKGSGVIRNASSSDWSFILHQVYGFLYSVLPAVPVIWRNSKLVGIVLGNLYCIPLAWQ